MRGCEFAYENITRQGANSEFHLIDERIVGSKPKSLDFVHAAAFPLTSITAYEAFFERLGIDVNGADKGETILIVGGAGGVETDFVGVSLTPAKRFPIWNSPVLSLAPPRCRREDH